MLSLSKWVVFGLMSQWLLTLFPMIKKISQNFWKGALSLKISSEVRSLAQSFTLGAIGIGAAQVNSFLDVLFARYVDVRGPAYLWYSIRIEQLAFALLGLACITPILPKLSRVIKGNQADLIPPLLSGSCRRIMTFMIPSTFAIMALGNASITVLYGGGHLSEVGIANTSLCLIAYSLGLIPTTLVVLFSAIFYANNDFKTPLNIALLTIFINVFLNLIFVFVFHFKTASVALSTSLSSWINFWILYKKISFFGWKPKIFQKIILKIILVSVLAWLFAVGVGYISLNSIVFLPLPGALGDYPKFLKGQIFWFLTVFAAFTGSILLLANFFKVGQMLEIFKLFRYKTGTKKGEDPSLQPDFWV